MCSPPSTIFTHLQPCVGDHAQGSQKLTTGDFHSDEKHSECDSRGGFGNNCDEWRLLHGRSLCDLPGCLQQFAEQPDPAERKVADEPLDRMGGNQIFRMPFDSGGVSWVVLEVIESREVTAGVVDEKQKDLAQVLRCGGAFVALANIGKPAICEPGEPDFVDIPRKQEHTSPTGQVVTGQLDSGNFGVI